MRGTRVKLVDDISTNFTQMTTQDFASVFAFELWTGIFIIIRVCFHKSFFRFCWGYHSFRRSRK